MNIDIDKYTDTVAAFYGNKQRAKVFLDRYALKDGEGNPTETIPEAMWERVAAGIASNDDEYPEFYGLLRDFKFVPGGRILAGAGTDTEVTFYNCYVIPVETEFARERRLSIAETGDPASDFEDDPHGADSRRAIFDTIGRMVDIMSRGGGVGINWSVLRPQGAYLKTVNGTSSGPVGWMDVASKAVGEVEQGGSRRGAAMFMLDDWHPDVLKFIEAKRDLSRITNANVSVAVSDEFMKAVKNDDEWTLMFPDTSAPEYDAEWDGDIGAWVNKGRPVKVYDTVKARDIWRALAQAAWDNGEPGVVFLDRYNKMSTGQSVERIISVNPCGEQGLGPYSVCNLGAMNLDAYIINGGAGYSPSGRSFDWDKFEDDVRKATRFLDRVIDKNHYFIPENERAQKDLRRIGLGVMGLADALIALGLRYGSPEAVKFTEQVFSAMKAAALAESVLLAALDGPAPAWDPTMANRPYLAHVPKWLHQKIRSNGLRNLFLLTQAPTGTTSILAGVNSGIEPYFAFGYWRNDRTGKHWVSAPAVEKYHDEALEKGDEFVTANEVSVEEHIAMQAAAQKHIDSSVSKTINAPNSHTIEDVEKAYTLAYDSGLKGLAYFRDGCGRAQVLTREDPSLAKVNEEVEDLKDRLSKAERNANLLHNLIGVRKSRPDSLSGETRKVTHAGGSAYVTLNRDDSGKPFEMFVLTGKAGSDVMMLGEALGRLGSLAMQHGASANEVADELRGIGGHRKFGASMPHAIGTAIDTLLMDDWDGPVEEEGEEFYYSPRPDLAVLDTVGDLQASDTMAQDAEATGQLCPECDSFSVVLEEGCSKCHVCGWSAC